MNKYYHFPDRTKQFRVNKKLQEKTLERWFYAIVNGSLILFGGYVFYRFVLFMIESSMKP